MPSLPQWLRRSKRTTSAAHTPSGGVSTTQALEGPSVPVGDDPTNPNIGVGVAVETNIASRGASHEVPHESRPSDTTVVGGNGWLALKEVLKTLKEMSVGPLAPLKTALIGVLAVMDHVEKVSDAQRDLFDLARQIESFKDIFISYRQKEDLPLVMYDRMDGILMDLSCINAAVESKTERGVVKRTIAAFKDVKDVVDIAKQVASLLDKFKIHSMLNTELKVEGIESNDTLRQLKHVSSAGIHALSQEGCMENTRISLLNELRQWCADATAPRIFWLDGMAGTGKSAIALSFSRFLRDNWLLGGSFFCLRGNGSRGDVRRILPTLAWYLARRDPQYRTSLLLFLREHPDVVDYTIEKQVEFLLEKPLDDAFIEHQDSQMTRPLLVLLIDALDECYDAEEVQRLLKRLISVSKDLPVKIFLTSRPERHILTEFESPLSDLHRILRLHDIEKDLVEADIRLYLRARLNMIRSSRSFPKSPLFEEWPSKSDVDRLTTLAGTLFIYAFTAVKYIAGNNPVGRLKTLTGFTQAVDAARPFYAALDNMYALVLSAALDPENYTNEEINTTKRILAAVLAAREPMRIPDMSRILVIDLDDIRMNLDRIRAVINVPPWEEDGVVSTFHASFADFLTAPGRAQESMKITLSAAHHDLADGCLKIMKSDLHFNIAECETSYLPNSEQHLATIAASLKYSCLYWGHHIAAADGASLLPQLEDVLFEKFLFWLEVLSVTRTIQLSSSILMQPFTSKTIQQNMRENLVTFLRDANEFVIAFREAVELSVPHIYLSAIPSLDKRSKISEVFWPRYSSTIKTTVQGITRERKPVLELRGHEDSVCYVRFSPDGTRIASGSFDKTIRMWDARTGEEVMKPLKGHTAWVKAVEFSPDGTHIISGSDDKTIRMWDARTGGEVMKPLEGHTNSVLSIGFSPDGTRIISGSSDKTIRMWDARTVLTRWDLHHIGLFRQDNPDVGC